MPSILHRGGTLLPSVSRAGASEAAVVIGSMILLVSVVLLCVKKKKSNIRPPSLKRKKGSWKANPSDRIALLESQVDALEAENVALRQNADGKLQLEIAELKRTTAMLLKAAPQPPPTVKHFLTEKFRPAWAMLLNIFPQSVALELDDYAAALSLCAEDFRQGVVDFVWDESNWHPETEGGGVHVLWDACNNDFDGLSSSGDPKIYINSKGEQKDMPSYGEGHPYASRRAPLTATALKLFQPASLLVGLVQRLATRVYACPSSTSYFVSLNSRGYCWRHRADDSQQ